jgi:hypothetical protein
VALEGIVWYGGQDWHSLHEFLFLSMIRVVRWAFGGISICILDWAETQAEEVDIGDMKVLERLVAPDAASLE